MNRRLKSDPRPARETAARGRGSRLALLALALTAPQVVAAEPALRLPDSRTAAAVRQVPSAPASPVADFRGEIASPDARQVADWAIGSNDNGGLPFLIVDKANARVFLFDGGGRLRGAAAALLGLTRGDDTIPGIGQRSLATIGPAERTTPAGRFVAALGHDLEQDILWVDYDSAISLHRVVTGNARDRRRERLASPSPLDNRISYGCINVPVAFYNDVVIPAFTATVGIVYILPEARPLAEVFAILPVAPVSVTPSRAGIPPAPRR